MSTLPFELQEAMDMWRRWAVEQTCGAVALPAADAEAKLEALRFLAMHAFFAVGPKGNKVSCLSSRSRSCVPFVFGFSQP
jgi:hypothetical protein